MLNSVENVTFCDSARSGQAAGAREQSQPLGCACWVMSPGCSDLGAGVGWSLHGDVLLSWLMQKDMSGLAKVW